MNEREKGWGLTGGTERREKKKRKKRKKNFI